MSADDWWESSSEDLPADPNSNLMAKLCSHKKMDIELRTTLSLSSPRGSSSKRLFFQGFALVILGVKRRISHLTVFKYALYRFLSPSLACLLISLNALQASSGSDIYRMEEQLITIITSNALINVLGSSGLQFSGIEILAVEPASIADVPGWWTEKVVLDSDSGLIAQAPAITSSLAPTGSSKDCYIEISGSHHAL